MGTTNNSLIRINDVINEGGVKSIDSINENTIKLIKDRDITKGPVGIDTPLFYNVTLKKIYGDTHLTKFQDLEIAKTYTVKLNVSLPLPALVWTGYTLYGFNAIVSYPNGTSKLNAINVTSLSTDKSIEIKDCCDNAKIKVSRSSGNSGATISSLTGEKNANVEINSVFTEGDGVICDRTLEYSCFTLTKNDNDDPIPSDNRIIDIYISTKDVDIYSLRIDSAVYGTGNTESELEDLVNKPNLQINIPDLIGEISVFPNSSAAAHTTIEVPVDTYVAVYLEASQGSESDSSTVSWAEGNQQSIDPGNTRVPLTYTINVIRKS